MQTGKLPAGLLSKLLGRVDIRDPRVVVGPKPGVDAAVIDIGDRYLVAKSDPITFATDSIGWYLVQVNANDIAVMGATPKWLLATLLLPESTTASEAEAIFERLLEACAALGISLIGGHTEITNGLGRPIAVGALLGEVEKDRLVLSSGARVGDTVVLTKGIAIEGAAVLAREAGDRLAAAGVRPETIARARELLYTPGISVVRDAAIIRSEGEVHAMHDPTEGGIATGLWEIAVASNVGMEVHEDRIHVVPECAEICAALGLDPWGLLASGALLAAVAPSGVRTLLGALRDGGIAATVIGEVTDIDSGILLLSHGNRKPLTRFARDELARYLSSAG